MLDAADAERGEQQNCHSPGAHGRDKDVINQLQHKTFREDSGRPK
jgi:hypothetical protein